MDTTSISIEREAIRRHLGEVEEHHEDRRVFSGFRAALNEARGVTGRNHRGEREEPPKAIWLGTLCYMALLDQIGSCFRRKDTPDTFDPGKTSDFKKSLYRFAEPSLSEAEINALYALRCSFAHDFGLLNWDKNRYTYRFHVGAGSAGSMITMPLHEWDRGFEMGNPEKQTFVNLELFGDCVEGICSRLTALADRDELEIVLPNGAEELIGRYRYSVRRR